MVVVIPNTNPVKYLQVLGLYPDLEMVESVLSLLCSHTTLDYLQGAAKLVFKC